MNFIALSETGLIVARAVTYSEIEERVKKIVKSRSGSKVTIFKTVGEISSETNVNVNVGAHA